MITELGVSPEHWPCGLKPTTVTNPLGPVRAILIPPEKKRKTPPGDPPPQVLVQPDDALTLLGALA